MADEILILVVRDELGNFKDLGAEISAGVWSARVTDPLTLAKLELIRARLDTGLALDAPTLAALENVNAAVTGTVALDAPTLAALETINAIVGTVALDAATLAALENITAAISGTVALDAPTLAALENVNAAVTGTVALDAATLAALETINAIVGTVEVSNFPADQKVHDDYATGEVLEDQPGAGAVLTFTFSAPVQMVVVESEGDGLVARANPFGAVPDVDTGIPCRHEVPTYCVVTTSTVKVFAPAGTTIAVWGFRRA